MGTSSFLPFHNYRFFTEQMDYQLDSLPLVRNDTRNIFQKRGMYFIHLNLNSLLSKIDKICYIAKLINATVIGLSKTNLGNTVLISELEIEGHGLVKSNRSRRGGGVACFVKNSISYNRKPNFCINIDSIFIEIFLSKSKPVLIGILYRSPNQYNFVNCLERTFGETNLFESHESYLLGDININLKPKDKEIFRQKSSNNINKEMIYCTRKKSYPNSINIMRFLFAQ